MACRADLAVVCWSASCNMLPCQEYEVTIYISTLLLNFDNIGGSHYFFTKLLDRSMMHTNRMKYVVASLRTKSVTLVSTRYQRGARLWELPPRRPP